MFEDEDVDGVDVLIKSRCLEHQLRVHGGDWEV